jgi:N-methylhydantoinase A
VEDALAAEAEFKARFEAIVGKGSSYTDTAIEVPTVTVEARVAVPSPDFSQPQPKSAAHAVRTRSAWFDGSAVNTPVYQWSDLGAGSRIAGPAFIESEQTTAVIYPGQQAVCDGAGNLTLLEAGSAK